MYKQITFLILSLMIVASCSINDSDVSKTVEPSQEARDTNPDPKTNEDTINQVEETDDYHIDKGEEGEIEKVIHINDTSLITFRNINKNVKKISFENIKLDDYFMLGNPDDNDKLYLLKKDFSEIKKISDYIYRGISELSEHMYVRNGNQMEIIPIENYTQTLGNLLKDEKVIKYTVDNENNKIYFIKDNKIYSLDDDNEQFIFSLGDDYTSQLTYHKGYLYYIQNHNLYQLNIRSKRTKKINQNITGDIKNYDIYNNNLFYIDTYYSTSKLWMTNLESGKTELFYEEDKDLKNLKILENEIYLWNHSYIKKLDLESKVLAEISLPTYASSFYFTKDRMIYKNFDQFFSIDYNLKENELVWGMGETKKTSVGVVNGQRLYICPETSTVINVDDENIEYGEMLNGDLVSSMISYNNKLYYIKLDDHYVYSLDVETKEKKLIVDWKVKDFYIFDNIIYFIDMDDNYSLNSISIGGAEATRIVKGPVANVYVDMQFIYYSNLKDRSSLYRFSKTDSSIQKVNHVPTGKVITIKDNIYFNNLLDPNAMYIKRPDKADTKKISNVVNFYEDRDSIYYLKDYGIRVLYRLDDGVKEQFISFMEGVYCTAVDLDFSFNQLNILYGCEGGNYDVESEELKQEKLEGFSTGDGNVYYFRPIWSDGIGYLYKLNTETGNVVLLTDEYTSRYYIKNDWIYFSSGHNGHLYRVDKNGDNKEFLIHGKYYDTLNLFITDQYVYTIKHGEGLVKINLIDKSEEIIFKEANQLMFVHQGYIGYTNEEGYLRIYGENKFNSYNNPQVKKVGFSEPWLFYILNSKDDGKKGELFKINYEGNSNHLIHDSVQDAILENKSLYYIDAKDQKIYQYHLDSDLIEIYVDQKVSNMWWNPLTNTINYMKAR